MKTYDETAESVLGRRNEYKNKKKCRSRLLAMLLAVCIALGTAAGFFITHNNNRKAEKQDTQISEKTDVSQKNAASDTADSVNSELAEIANQRSEYNGEGFLSLKLNGREYTLWEKIEEKFVEKNIAHTTADNSDVGGEIYTVKGFDQDFALCVKSDVNEKYYAFFTRDFGDDTDIGKGVELIGENAFNLKSFIDSAEYQSHSDWDKAIKIYRKLDGVEKEDLEKLIDCVSAAEAIPSDNSYDEILSGNPVQRHLILNLSGEWPFRMVTLSLFEGGYVRFDSLSAPGTLFKVTDPVFDKIFDAAKDISASVKELQENAINTDSTQ